MNTKRFLRWNMIGQVEFNYYFARGGAQFLSLCHPPLAGCFASWDWISDWKKENQNQAGPDSSQRVSWPGDDLPLKVELCKLVLTRPDLTWGVCWCRLCLWRCSVTACVGLTPGHQSECSVLRNIQHQPQHCSGCSVRRRVRDPTVANFMRQCWAPDMRDSRARNVSHQTHCGNERMRGSPGSPVTACNEKSLISFSKMAFVILQNILKWHSSKILAGGTNLWVGFGGLNVRCEIRGGSHQFQ